ncbi:DNA polymerase [Paraburkholderia bannensis]|uniref:Type-4 uracil-DNA glycosylase n=1 Tax=Paraburkholderia bannensis TaxID=765414 RepID=A0A7W9WSA7_9BURK|nr:MULTISPECIES: uracil-DNA glycosylase [Paraburkholderia]MBB3256534.1 DNA polymerase [Paraburkholderia sp. WP4_3_2]MBB6101533.1 DNA polymerase [Paraburkholderia bannensis]
MPLDEIALEELGLAPRWVRKGVAAVAPQEAIAAAASVAVAVEAEVEVEVAAPPVVAREASAPAPLIEGAAPPKARAEDAFAPEDAPFVQPERVAPAKPAPAASEEPPAFTEDDFAWFDSVSEAVLPHDVEPARAPRNDVATLDWEPLAERVASCTLCRLCEKRTNTVFGVGDREAEWMVIGEAPGENEDRQGEPFVGQAGKLLDNMLRSLALARGENVYIANVIKCRPPGNRNPEPDEVARCEPYLQRQVALVKPKIIVAMGRFAAQSLLKTSNSIASLRGRVHEYEGVPVIVTYHPAYLLRSLQDKSKAWTDLCLARDTWRAAGGGQ